VDADFGYAGFGIEGDTALDIAQHGELGIEMEVLLGCFKDADYFVHNVAHAAGGRQTEIESGGNCGDIDLNDDRFHKYTSQILKDASC